MYWEHVALVVSVSLNVFAFLWFADLLRKMY